jgi:hypothetical protein
VISLFNKCIEAAPNLTRLRSSEFKIAEGEYSRSRLRALGDEWNLDYPGLLDFVKILHNKTKSFKISSINSQEIDELCLKTVIENLENPNCNGILQQYAFKLVDCVIDANDFKKFMIQVFYKIGLVGLKLLPHESESWVYEIGRSVSAAELTEDVSVVIHPAYYRALGIRY